MATGQIQHPLQAAICSAKKFGGVVMHFFFKREIPYTRFSIFVFFSIIIIFLILLYSKNAFSYDASIVWDENKEEDIAGYKIFCRQEGQNYDYNVPVWVGLDVNCTIYRLDETITYYFVARAFNTSGIESKDSEELKVELIDGEIKMNTSTNTYNFVGNGCFITAGDRSL